MNNIGFVIACENYDGISFSKLSGVKKDAETMITALSKNCACNNIVEISSVNKECEPTGRNILELISHTSDSYTNAAIDNLYLYYSGHGVMDSKDDAFLVPCDAYKEGPTQHGLLQLNSVIQFIKTKYNVKHILVFLDMCLSDFPAKGTTDSLKLDYYPKGVVVFYSCFPHNSSYMAPDASGSFFTRSLVSVFNKGEVETVSQVSDSLRDQMQEICRTAGIRQTPYTTLEDASLSNLAILFHNNGVHSSYFFSSLSTAEQDAVKAFSSKIDLSNTEQITHYGTNAENNIIQMQANLPSLINEIINLLKEISLVESSFLTLLRRIDSPFRKWLYKLGIVPEPSLDDINNKATTITHDLELILLQLNKKTGVLTTMNAKVGEYIKEVKMYVIAGEFARKENDYNENELFIARLKSLNEAVNSIESIQNPLDDCITLSLILCNELRKILFYPFSANTFEDIVLYCQRAYNDLVATAEKRSQLFLLYKNIRDLICH